MKRIVLVFLLLNLCFLKVNALESNRKKVELIKCEDAVSAWIKIDGVKTRIRFIAIDTSDGKLNKEIDMYVCDLLKKAKVIEIEYDPHCRELDEYNRLNVWIYADSVLLQNDLISKGYAQVNYVSSNYLHLKDLCENQREAIKSSLGIWQYPNQEEKYCRSGINISDNTSNEVVEEINSPKKDLSYLYDMISLIIFIVVLSLVIKFKKEQKW